MAQPAQQPSKLKTWTERLALVSAIVAILGLTVSGVIGTAWQAVWNYFDPPPPLKTHLVPYDPWLAPDAEKQAKVAKYDRQSRCQGWSIRPWGGTRRCFIDDGVYDDCFPEPDWIRDSFDSSLVACVTWPDRHPVYRRIAHFEDWDTSRKPKNVYTPAAAWMIRLHKSVDVCARHSGTSLGVAGVRTIMSCRNRGFVIGIVKEDRLWYAEYLKKGQAEIRRVEIETVWF